MNIETMVTGIYLHMQYAVLYPHRHGAMHVHFHWTMLATKDSLIEQSTILIKRSQLS